MTLQYGEQEGDWHRLTSSWFVAPAYAKKKLKRGISGRSTISLILANVALELHSPPSVMTMRMLRKLRFLDTALVRAPWPARIPSQRAVEPPSCRPSASFLIVSVDPGLF